ncbi:MAG: efflux RND transporter permease subunit, partial [Planctomycetota bacterium]|nr:efflux RND transporter permease subunit [Planctomycetota bacterium]
QKATMGRPNPRAPYVALDVITAGARMPLREAILESGAVRMRPIFLTAATTVMGAVPITFDPVFSGLAWALIFGLLASTAFTLLVVPSAYYMFARRANA